MADRRAAQEDPEATAGGSARPGRDGAHEVRNSLSGLLATTQALCQELGDRADLDQYWNMIRLNVDRLSTLMRDLLELGKPVHPSEALCESATAICARSVALWRQATPTPTHAVVLEARASLEAYVQGDIVRLEEVFVNLLENASHHSPPESSITPTIIRDEGQSRVRVVDRGAGVAPEYLERFFEPFFTTPSAGSGLGLFLVRAIVEAHGGKVAIWNNTPPPGSTLEVTLPTTLPAPALGVASIPLSVILGGRPSARVHPPQESS